MNLKKKLFIYIYNVTYRLYVVYIIYILYIYLVEKFHNVA